MNWPLREGASWLIGEEDRSPASSPADPLEGAGPHCGGSCLEGGKWESGPRLQPFLLSHGLGHPLSLEQPLRLFLLRLSLSGDYSLVELWLSPSGGCAESQG